MPVNVVLVNGNVHAVVPAGETEGKTDEELHHALITGGLGESWLVTNTGARVAVLLVAEVLAL